MKWKDVPVGKYFRRSLDHNSADIYYKISDSYFLYATLKDGIPEFGTHPELSPEGMPRVLDKHNEITEVFDV